MFCCVFGVSFIHPFPKRHCCSTLNTHTHLIHIYNNEKYGIVSCEYGIVLSRLRGERREKTFASLFSLSLSIRFFFSSRVFDDEMKRGGNKKFVVPRRAKSTAKEDDDDDEYRVVFRRKRKETVSKR